MEGKVGRFNDPIWNELTAIQARTKWNVVCLTETHWYGGVPGRSLPSFKLYHTQRTYPTKAGGGIAVMIHNDVPSRRWRTREPASSTPHHIEDTEILWVLIGEGPTQIALGVVYLATGSNQETNKWNSTLHTKILRDVNTLRGEGTKVLLLGDFNGHLHRLQQPQGTDPNGRFLEHLHTSHILNIINLSTICKGINTWTRGDSSTCIDYVLADDNTTQHIQSMHIDELQEFWTLGQDHHFIEVILKLQVTRSTPKPKIFYWPLRDNIDWEEYAKHVSTGLSRFLEENLHIPPATQDVSIYDLFIEAFISAADRALPRPTSAKAKKSRNATISRLTTLRNRRKTQWLQARKKDDPQTTRLHKEYKKTQDSLRKAHIKDRLRRRTKWQKQLIQQGGPSSKKLWNSFHSKTDPLEAVLTTNGISSHPQTVIEAIQGHFARKHSEAAPPTAPPTTPAQSAENHGLQENINQPFTHDEVGRIVKNLPNGKAAGPDHIPNEILKKGGSTLISSLTYIFNVFLAISSTPPEWNDDITHLIYKKDSPVNLDNYREISLTSNISKIFTRALAKRISSNSEMYLLLPESQAGFREDRRPEDHLFTLSTIIDYHKHHKKPLYLCFVDVKSAYDTVNRGILWQILVRLGLGHSFVTLLNSLYNNNTRTITWKGHKTTFPVQTGLRQGCPLSPVLFALLTAHIPEALDRQQKGIYIGGNHISNLFFADDILLCSSSPQDLQALINTLTKELHGLSLQINTAKTKIMRLGHGSTQAFKWHTNTVPNTPIEEVDHYKYLGVYFSSGRSNRQAKHTEQVALFKSHLVKSSAIQSMDRTEIANILWTHQARPAILYGTDVTILPATTITKLEAIQSNLTKWILTSTTSSSSRASRLLLRWQSLTSLIDRKQLLYWARLTRMEHSRLPSIVFRAFSQPPNPDFKWHNKILQLQEKYHVHSTTLVGLTTNKRIADITRITSKMSDINTLVAEGIRVFTPPLDIVKKCIYSTNKKNVLYLWNRDAYRIIGAHKTCPLCTSPLLNWQQHIIIQCQHPEITKYRGGNATQKDWTSLLANYEENNLETLGRLVTAWKALSTLPPPT